VHLRRAGGRRRRVSIWSPERVPRIINTDVSCSVYFYLRLQYRLFLFEGCGAQNYATASCEEKNRIVLYERIDLHRHTRSHNDDGRGCARRPIEGCSFPLFNYFLGAAGRRSEFTSASLPFYLANAFGSLPFTVVWRLGIRYEGGKNSKLRDTFRL